MMRRTPKVTSGVPASLQRLVALLLLAMLVGCVGQPEVRPRPALSLELEEQARERMTGRWEARLASPETEHPFTLTFDDSSLVASANGIDEPAQAWLPTAVSRDTIVLVVVHDTHVRQAAVRFETPDRFRLDEFYSLVFERAAPALPADSPSVL